MEGERIGGRGESQIVSHGKRERHFGFCGQENQIEKGKGVSEGF